MSNPDVKAMEQIMAKMNNAVANADQIKTDRAEGKVVVNESNKEMFDILQKLQNATASATKKMITESPIESAVTTKKEKTIYVYSDDNCRIDKTGGPYEVRIRKSDNKWNR